MPRERRSRPTAPGNGVKNGPRARQNPLLGAEFYPGAIPIEALLVRLYRQLVHRPREFVGGAESDSDDWSTGREKTDYDRLGIVAWGN